MAWEKIWPPSLSPADKRPDDVPVCAGLGDRHELLVLSRHLPVYRTAFCHGAGALGDAFLGDDQPLQRTHPPFRRAHDLLPAWRPAGGVDPWRHYAVHR